MIIFGLEMFITRLNENFMMEGSYIYWYMEVFAVTFLLQNNLLIYKL